MMQYTTIDGVRASRVAQGCMRISSLTAAQLDRLVRTDLEGGINFFDHADIYGGGACEERFGEFLHENPSLRGQMLIQTKCGIRKGMYDFSRAHILFCADRSLQLLKTDYLDFLLLHRPDALCEPEEVADAFETLKKAGTLARTDMEKFFGCKVNLKLWVKVKEDWRNRQNLLQSFGYDCND